MSTAKAVFSLIMFVFWVSMAIYFAHHIYVLQVVKPAALEKLYQEQDAEYDALYRNYCSDPKQAAYDPQTCDKYTGKA
jgi:hypothetical protein